MSKTKSVFFAKLKTLIQNKFRGQKLVLVGGCFDILHYGHIKFLQAAKKQGDLLVVALESDGFIKKHKYRKPIHNQKQRQQILTQLKFVDLVIALPYLSSYSDYLRLVQTIKPKVIAVTAADPQLHNKQKQAQKVGATVKIKQKIISGFSTSNILEKLGLE